jgi:sugar O-acyltransferase (sialic acid O-acetyltransferase NeuD family)
MSTPLVLLAASGLAREVLATLELQDELEVRGVLDDAPNLQRSEVGGRPVLGTLDQVRRHDDARLLVCAGSGRSRSAIVERLSRLGVSGDRYATVVHPSVVVGASSRVGAGSILLASTVLTSDVTLGRHVVTMPNVTVTHDDQVGDFATLCAGVSLGGGVRIGQAAYLGMNSTVREHTMVGDAAVLGMGAVLLRDLPPGETWLGVPAGPRRRRSSSGTTAGHSADCGSVA